MKRSRWIGGSLAVISLTLAACGSDGPKTLSEDDFVSAMDDVCRDATRSLDRLDPEDSSYIDDVIDVMQQGVDDLSNLNPPKALENDVNDFIDNLDAQITQAEKLKKAIDDEDQEKSMEISAKLDDLAKESNDIADSIGADRCKDVSGGGGTTDTTPATTPNTPLPIDTTEPTSPPVTEPPVTEPASTMPEMTAPPTQPSAGTAGDASTLWQAPAGYTWGVLDDLAGTATPADDPTIGPLLEGYYAGLLTSDTGGGALIYVTLLNQETDWTPEQLAAYYTFELVGDGTDTTTPQGIPARVKVNAIDGYDAAAITGTGVGVAVVGPTGTDLLGLLDGFVSAQNSG